MDSSSCFGLPSEILEALTINNNTVISSLCWLQVHMLYVLYTAISD